jgi:hypothetical protein
MELIEIIKQTIFLIILLGFGIFSLSYSIYRIRTKSRSDKLIHSEPVFEKEQNITLNDQKFAYKNSNNDLRRKTAERYIVLNDLSSADKRKYPAVEKSRNGYHLQSIRNTGMYTLTFE